MMVNSNKASNIKKLDFRTEKGIEIVSLFFAIFKWKKV